MRYIALALVAVLIIGVMLTVMVAHVIEELDKILNILQ